MQQRYRFLSLILAISLIFGSATLVTAQDNPVPLSTPAAEEEENTDSDNGENMSTQELLEEFTPSLVVRDQVFTVREGISVVVPELFATEDNWVVIHRDDNGAPGEVLGYTFVEAGPHYEVSVALTQDIEGDIALWAMLHVDAGEAGTYEFPGADVPVQLDGQVVMASFTALEPGIIISNQALENNSITVEGVVSAADSWLVIHRSENGEPGEILGYAPIAPGVTPNVRVDLNGDLGNDETLWAMLHFDLGTRGEFEFPGADEPVSTSRGVVMSSFSISSQAGETQAAADSEAAAQATTTPAAETEADAQATATPMAESEDATATPTAAAEMAAPLATATPMAAAAAPDVLPMTGASLTEENNSALPWLALILGVMVAVGFVIVRRRLA